MPYHINTRPQLYWLIRGKGAPACTEIGQGIIIAIFLHNKWGIITHKEGCRDSVGVLKDQLGKKRIRAYTGPHSLQNWSSLRYCCTGTLLWD